MIKKLIFDLDDTLIINKDYFVYNYEKIIDKYKLNCDIKELYSLIGKYELSTKRYDKYELLNMINDYFNSNFSIELIDDVIDAVGMWVEPVSQDVIDTLKYLSNKYELYVLTNWFKKSQVNRLKKAGIYDFFIGIKSAEEYTKPSKEAFEQFYKDCLPEECLMIGDNYKIDIEVPDELGMKTIMCNFKNKDIKYDGKIITNFKELVELL